MISTIGALHFVPINEARDNLLNEGGDPSSIMVTGKTVVDALQHFQKRLAADPDLISSFAERFDFPKPDRRLILVSAHRRENFDGSIQRLCRALLTITTWNDVQIVSPMHANPNVQGPVSDLLSSQPDTAHFDPLDYSPFVYLMTQTEIILIDLGSIQEEALALGKPVPVIRETNERPEGVAAGTALLVGTDQIKIVSSLTKLLDDRSAYEAMSLVHNPYGDGKASERIITAIMEYDRLAKAA